MFERPITTASRPARSPSPARRSMQAAERRARHEAVGRPGRAGRRSPGGSRRRPCRDRSRRSPCRVDLGGSGSWTRMPSTASSALRRSIRASSSASRVSAGSVCSKLSMPASASPCPWSGRRPARRDRRRPAPPPARARARGGTEGGDLGSDPPRRVAAAALPSISRAVIGVATSAQCREQLAQDLDRSGCTIGEKSIPPKSPA